MIKKSKVYLSIIIPVFNESTRIYHLKEIMDYLKKKRFKTEVIVVNDGSKDDTLNKLKDFNKRYKFEILNYDVNKGKGYAIRKGMLQARGEYRLFTDIDLSTPINEIDNFLPLIEKYHIVIGTRKSKGAKLIVHQHKARELLGKCFTFLSQIMLNTHVSDFTCGFKCFSQKSVDKIFPQLTINRWGFDSEILYLATKYNLSIKEVTVQWKNDPLTKVKFPQDIIRSLGDLITIRLNDFKKLYTS